MIVKIQVPLYTNDPCPQALVYNEDKSFTITIPLTRGLVKHLGGKPKGFFNIERITGGIRILDSVTDQGW